MKIRMTVSPETFARLSAAIKDETSAISIRASSLWPEGYGSYNYDWEESHTVCIVGSLRGKVEGREHDLEIDIEVLEILCNQDFYDQHGHQATDKQVNEVKTSREAINALFEILGIFPDEAGVKGREAKITKQLEEITRLAGKMIERAEGDRDRSLVTNLPHSTVQDAERIIELCSKI